MPAGDAPAPKLARVAVVVGAATLVLGSSFLLAPAPATRAATTASQLRAAKAKLDRLEHAISAQRAALARSQAAIASLLAQVDVAQRAYDATAARLRALRASLAAAEASYRQVRARLDQRAMDAFEAGPASGLEFLLGSSSFADMADRLEYLDALQQGDSDLVGQIRDLANELNAKRRDQLDLLGQQAAQLKRLSERRAQLEAAFAKQQRQIGAMAAERTQVLALVSHLHKQLRAEQLAAARGSLLGSRTAPFGTWASLFLSRVGAPGCHSDMVAVVAWETAEYTQAAWNPLATTYPMPGATIFNSAGVRNYVSIDQGLEASVDTLRAGQASFGYGAIVSSLRRCADPMATARAINASAWCRGCAGGGYVTDMVPIVETYYSRYARL